MAGTPARLEEAFAMLVHDIMQPRVITAPPQTDVAEALAILRTRGVRHLVILDGDALVGIVSDRDVKQAGALDERLGRWTVGDIMSRSVITIEPSAPVEDAAQLMLTNTISALRAPAGGAGAAPAGAGCAAARTTVAASAVAAPASGPRRARGQPWLRPPAPRPGPPGRPGHRRRPARARRSRRPRRSRSPRRRAAV